MTDPTQDEKALFERLALTTPRCDAIRGVGGQCTSDAILWGTGHWARDGKCYNIGLYACGPCAEELKQLYCSKHMLTALIESTPI